uniref:Uncharacterized protein n=1 Tax=viral metagenome TaxID=1070528 RepID=A0A6C0KF18_9ZZZZ
MDNLDSTWIEDFDEDELYNEFYQDNVTSINLFFIHMNDENEIKTIRNQEENIENNILKKERIMTLIKENTKKENKEYQFVSLLKFNFDINNKELDEFLEDGIKVSKYLTSLSYLSDIHWNNTILFFQKLNGLYLLFKERKPISTPIKNILKLKDQKSSDTKSTKKTKRVYFNINKNITRKRYNHS